MLSLKQHIYIEQLVESVIDEQFITEARSAASIEADRLQLDYYGFGRYGKDRTVTHEVVNDKLTPVKEPRKVTKYAELSGKQEQEKERSKESGTINDIFKKTKSMSPEEFSRKVGKIPPNESTTKMRAFVKDYLKKAKAQELAAEIAWKNKTTVEKVKQRLEDIATVVFRYIDPEKLGKALGDVMIKIIESAFRALLKK